MTKSYSSIRTSLDYDPVYEQRDSEVEDVVATVSDEGEQLDAIANIRGWYSTRTDAAFAIKRYMAFEQDAQTTISALAEPIDQAFSTADGGSALWEAERVARHQRAHAEDPEYGPGEVERAWGLPQEFPEPSKHEPSMEGLLWQLWFGVVHAARRTSWKDEVAQERLVDLVTQFKSRPDPPLPHNATKALRNDSIWKSGEVWSNLNMFGSAAREDWNMVPGGGAGYSQPEIHAWINVNAFVARLTVAGVIEQVRRVGGHLVLVTGDGF